MEQKTSIEVVTFQTVNDLVNQNKPIIQTKVEACLAVMSKIIKVETDAEDKLANDTLVKVNATLPTIDSLRKEYTSKVDAWKKSEMELEKSVKVEIERIKTLRNERANNLAAKKTADDKALLEKKNKDQEIIRVKNEMKDGVTLGIAQRISGAKASLIKMFADATLENVDLIPGKLNSIKPLLKEDQYLSFLIVPYNDKLITLEEMKDLQERAAKHFDYKKCNENYIAIANNMIDEFKKLAPVKKEELLKIKNAPPVEAEAMKAKAAETANALIENLKAEADTNAKVIKAETAKETQKEQVTAEFQYQATTQTTQEQDNTRKKISYRFSDEKKINDAAHVINIMQQVMMHCFSDIGFLGIIERDSKSKLPKRGDKGEILYSDGVNFWLDALAKINPVPEIEGLTRNQDVIAINKASKPK